MAAVDSALTARCASLACGNGMKVTGGGPLSSEPSDACSGACIDGVVDINGGIDGACIDGATSPHAATSASEAAGDGGHEGGGSP